MIPEFRELIETANAYLDGKLHYSYVCTKTNDFLFYSKQLKDPRIREIAEDWHEKSIQVWDEWGQLQESKRISEAEFKEWIKGQLAIINDEF